ncbi:hypothetical protein KDK95_08770 [Actinospica sp. MGRD01-02]|uniref:Uncharacterized protein n=1 Tax=Actinospica acidithermotolerans TaxID=2828514 RepID=A0A941II43_9ACTN|nr:hypothetical protein [Actinospica acidithermotolerans]MBR7826392.1 hypothetical protein [Actinospica acidithermotolerans]
MQVNDLSALLNAELGAEALYRFEAGVRAVAGSPAVLTHEEYAVAVHTNADGYRLSFWWKGRELGHGWSASVASIARAADKWVREVGLEHLSAEFPFVTFTGLQLAYEQGRATEFQWQALLGGAGGAYRELIELASRDSVLSALFPQTGHRLALLQSEDSSDALASIFAVRPGWFVVYQQGGEDVEFEGGAEAMVSYLSNKLKL